MNKYVPFVRKAKNISEIARIKNKYFGRLPLYRIEIITEISLDISIYTLFAEHMLDDYDFLFQFANESYFYKRIAKCVKITCEDNTTKPAIYVVLEGTSYAKYSFSNHTLD
jgi:hypothetical protein